MNGCLLSPRAPIKLHGDQKNLCLFSPKKTSVLFFRKKAELFFVRPKRDSSRTRSCARTQSYITVGLPLYTFDLCHTRPNRTNKTNIKTTIHTSGILRVVAPYTKLAVAMTNNNYTNFFNRVIITFNKGCRLV